MYRDSGPGSSAAPPPVVQLPSKRRVSSLPGAADFSGSGGACFPLVVHCGCFDASWAPRRAEFRGAWPNEFEGIRETERTNRQPGGLKESATGRTRRKPGRRPRLHAPSNGDPVRVAHVRDRSHASLVVGVLRPLRGRIEGGIESTTGSVRLRRTCPRLRPCRPPA